jgi:hypothetical protein
MVCSRFTHHRIIGAILVYLSIAVIFTSLYTIIGLIVPNAFSGMSFEDNPALASKVIYFSFVTLTSTGYLSNASCCTQPLQSGNDNRSALSRNLARPAGIARD